MADIKTTVRQMLSQGQDPKEFVLQYCKPKCTWYQDKLGRCEVKLKEIKHLDPEKSCMYPLRDLVTCLDGCAQPIIHKELRGCESGFIS